MREGNHAHCAYSAWRLQKPIDSDMSGLGLSKEPVAEQREASTRLSGANMSHLQLDLQPTFQNSSAAKQLDDELIQPYNQWSSIWRKLP